MAAELIKSVLAAETKGRQMEADARKKAEKFSLFCYQVGHTCSIT